MWLIANREINISVKAEARVNSLSCVASMFCECYEVILCVQSSNRQVYSYIIPNYPCFLLEEVSNSKNYYKEYFFKKGYLCGIGGEASTISNKSGSSLY